MKTIIPQSSSGWRLSGFSCILAVLALPATLPSNHACAQGIRSSRFGEKIIVESNAASQVREKVRSAAPGVLVEVLVNVGDTVKKGQILGHMELAATKYQLDLARHTMRNTASLRAMQAQAEAWTATREETEEAVRKRKVEESRLEWASNMEKYHRSNYEAQLEQKKLQRIQYEYWQQQYENRFFRAPVDGVVTEVLLEVGQSVNYATHVFTIGNKDSYVVPVMVPAELADLVSTGSLLAVRAVNGRHVARGLVDSILDDPKEAGGKIIRLLVNRTDFPLETSSNLSGTKFDVLLPLAAGSRDDMNPHTPPTGDPRTSMPAETS